MDLFSSKIVYGSSLENWVHCSVLDLKKSNQIKSNPKYSKIWFGFEKFFNSMIWFGFALIFVKNPNQTKSNKKKRSGNALFVSLSSRKSEIPHKNSRLFGLILRNGLKYRCLSVSNRRQQWISSNRLTLRKIFLFP